MRKKGTVIAVVLVIYGLMIYGAGFIGINITKSVPFTVYIINKSKVKIVNGSFVLFNKQADPLNVLPENAKLVKEVACSPGSSLTSDTAGFYCDGERVAVRRDKEKMKFFYNGKLPEGKYFVTGGHLRSYDSRIWGLLDEKNIISTVSPLF